MKNVTNKNWHEVAKLFGVSLAIVALIALVRNAFEEASYYARPTDAPGLKLAALLVIALLAIAFGMVGIKALISLAKALDLTE